MSEFEGEPSAEDKSAALEYDQAKGESNLARANEIRKGREPISGPELENLPEVYPNSTIFAKLQGRQNWGQDPVVTFFDIDRTFLDRDNPQATEDFAEVLEKASIANILVTGRGGTGVDRNDSTITLADVVVSNAGTQIYVRQKNGQYLRDENFADMMRENWQDDLVSQALEETVKGAASPNIFIPNEPRMEFERVLHIRGGEDNKKRTLELLDKNKPDGTKALTWGDPNGSYAAIIPEGGGKKESVIYLTKIFGIRGVTGGDSDLDIDMLLNSGHPGILVGGSTEEAQVSVVKATREHWGQLRRADNNQLIYQALGKASQGLSEALKKGWLNPGAAKDFVLALYNLKNK